MLGGRAPQPLFLSRTAVACTTPIPKYKVLAVGTRSRQQFSSSTQAFQSNLITFAHMWITGTSCLVVHLLTPHVRVTHVTWTLDSGDWSLRYRR